MYRKSYILLGFILFTYLQNSLAQTPVKDDGLIKINLLQLNDVYEIAALDNGAVGGMARVATIRKRLMQENPNTYTILSGDFLFPSAIGTMFYEGKAIKGRQMTEAMNSAGVDLVTFGNHEFDLKENELIERINQSSFDWIGSNVWHNTQTGKQAFTKIEKFNLNPIPQTRVLVFKDTDNTELKIGLFSITINTTQIPYVIYDDYINSAKDAINTLRSQCDFIIGVTHLSIDDDILLAKAFPEVKLLIGGHEHVHSFTAVGNTFIAKADANARTVYVHELLYDKRTKDLKIKSDLVSLDKSIVEDDQTLQVVNKWIGIADKSLKDQGFDPKEILANVSEPYDGRESEIRFRSTNLTRLIGKAISVATPGTDGSIYNSGGIRLDDELTGIITQYDVIRTLPYGGKIMVAEMKGSIIKKAIETSYEHKGNGCFLQIDKIDKNSKGEWTINNKKLKDDKVYKIAVNDYLVSGLQQYLEFLNDKNPDILKISSPDVSDSLRYDLRKAIINYIRLGGR